MLRRTLRTPVRVLVLTMVPDGGAMVPALQRLGYKPYNFKSAFERGHASTHPVEWSAVIQGKKKLDLRMLDQYDALIGPPSAIAFDRVLHACPKFTQVILVEEQNKEQWSRDYEQYVVPLLKLTEKTSKRSIGLHFHNMIASMFPQDKKLGRVAALELWEERVKNVIPSDNLLVYRYGDGWEPLCRFLGKEKFMEMLADTPFPPYDAGMETVLHLENRIYRMERLTLYLMWTSIGIMLLLFLPLAGSITDLVKEYYRDFTLAFATEVGTLEKEGRERELTLRKAMVISKNVTMNFEEKMRDQGGVSLGGGGGSGSVVVPEGKDATA